MDQLDGMRTFIAVVETGSFTAAGTRLGISNKLVSKYISQLETDLKVNLLHRTTRSMSITPEGQVYLEGCRRVIGEFDLLEASLEQTTGLRGDLRIAAPLTFGETIVAKAACEFMQAYPDVTVELNLSDVQVDIAQGGFDMAIRIGQLADSSLIARKLAETEMIVVAAPSYLKKNGTPQHPSELADHICIRDANDATHNRWAFLVEGQELDFPVQGPYIANSAPACLVPAREGIGILLCPSVFVADDLAKGQLLPVLTGFPSKKVAIQSVQLPSAFKNPKVKAFTDILKQEIEQCI